MSSQMMILAQQTEVLSEHGMPGDSTEVELIPLDEFTWDSTRWHGIQPPGRTITFG